MAENGAGTAVQYQGQGGSVSVNQPGGSVPFTMPEKFQGKSAEEIARVFVENEKTWGSRNDYDTLKARNGELEQQTQLIGKMQEALQSWEQYRPALEAVGWDPKRITQASNATPQGQPDFLTQRLSKYGEILDVQEQARYLLQDVLAPLYQADQQRVLQGVGQAMKQAIEDHEGTVRQREKLLFSMLKRALPDVAWDDIYGNAMKVAEQASKGFDPFELDREREAERKRIESEAEKRYEQKYNDRIREMENKRLATVTGSTKVSASRVKPDGPAARRTEAMRRLKEVAPDL